LWSAEQQKQIAEEEKTAALRQAYISDMLLVQRDWEDANIAHARELLDRYKNSEVKGFEWDYWNRKLQHNVYTLTDHSATVYSARFSPDGKRIVSGSRDMTLKIWDAETGQETLTLTGHLNVVNSAIFSPDGKRIVSGSYDNTLKIWDAETGQETLTLKGHSATVNCVIFSPDGKRIVSGSSDKTLKIWDARPIKADVQSAAN